jgi:outer membrane protein OmpA-like peptidoglycan-associated protein
MTSNITGSTTATIQSGQTTQTAIDLQTGPVIANMFLIHFARDSAFIEPPMRLVLEQVVNYAATHPDEKLLIVGHTDLTGSEEYNQSLSERRARSAYAFLTYGNFPEAALAEWNTLRMKRPRGELPSIKDSWGVCEYQFMLQDLGYYIGSIDGKHGPMTDSGVRTFQKSHQLTEDGIVGQQTWETLIKVYLDQSQFSLSTEKFFSKDGEILKWLGCGEKDPVANKPVAWRPNRRTEFLFVKTDSFDFSVAKPDTFELPEIGFIGDEWKFGLPDSEERCGFSVRVNAEVKKEEREWRIQPAEPGTVIFQGLIEFEDGRPFANGKYALIAPDGECMDGEHPTKGQVVFGRTDSDGFFSYSNIPKRLRVFCLAVKGPYLISSKSKSFSKARGKLAWESLTVTSTSSQILAATSYLAEPPKAISETSKENLEFQLRYLANIEFMTLQGRSIQQIQIEGILNQEKKPESLTQEMLLNKKFDLFLIKAKISKSIPEGIESIPVKLRSYCPITEQLIDEIEICLDYFQKENIFSSRFPALVIPAATRREEIEAIDFDFIRARAGGFITVNIADESNLPEQSIQACGQVIYIYAQIFGAGGDGIKFRILSPEKVREQISEANKIWSQVGIEVREREILQVSDPGHFINPDDVFLITDLTVAEPDDRFPDKTLRILGVHDECRTSPLCCPTKSPYASTDVNVYYLDRLVYIDKPYKDDPGGYIQVQGYAFSNSFYDREVNDCIYLSLLKRSVVLMALETDPNILAHEIGHLILRDWPMSHHYDLNGRKWPEGNLMNPYSSIKNVNFHDTQAEHIIKLERKLKGYLLAEADFNKGQEEKELTKELRLMIFGENYCASFEPRIG